MSIKKALLRKKRKNESYGKYVFAVTHLWLGLLSSLVVLILCITGSVYAFKEPISKWINYEKIHLSSVPKSYSLLQIEADKQLCYVGNYVPIHLKLSRIRDEEH